MTLFGEKDIFKVTGSGPGPPPVLEHVCRVFHTVPLIAFHLARDLEIDQVFGSFCTLGPPVRLAASPSRLTISGSERGWRRSCPHRARRQSARLVTKQSKLISYQGSFKEVTSSHLRMCRLWNIFLGINCVPGGFLMSPFCRDCTMVGTSCPVSLGRVIRSKGVACLLDFCWGDVLCSPRDTEEFLS